MDEITSVVIHFGSKELEERMLFSAAMENQYTRFRFFNNFLIS
jgi:hypothetical protein